jgi:hypothetical protein
MTVYNATTFIVFFFPISTAANAFNWSYVTACAAGTVMFAFCFIERSARYDYDKMRVVEKNGLKKTGELEFGAIQYCFACSLCAFDIAQFFNALVAVVSHVESSSDADLSLRCC